MLRKDKASTTDVLVHFTLWIGYPYLHPQVQKKKVTEFNCHNSDASCNMLVTKVSHEVLHLPPSSDRNNVYPKHPLVQSDSLCSFSHCMKK